VLRAPQEISYLSRQKSFGASDTKRMLQRTRRHEACPDLSVAESQLHASADALGETSRTSCA